MRASRSDDDPFARQVGGSHYKSLAVQPTEYIIRNGIPFCEGNVIKYVTRWVVKRNIEDLNKAVHYLQLLMWVGESKGD